MGVLEQELAIFSLQIQPENISVCELYGFCYNCSSLGEKATIDRMALHKQIAMAVCQCSFIHKIRQWADLDSGP